MRIFIQDKKIVIATLFFCIAICCIQGYLGQRRLSQAELYFQAKVVQEQEQQRAQIERFVALHLTEDQALLKTFVDDKAEGAHSWLSLATFFMFHPQIDSLKSGMLSICSRDIGLQKMEEIPIDKELFWVTSQDATFLGIRFPLLGIEMEESIESSGPLLLFTWESILSSKEKWKQVCSHTFNFQDLSVGFSSPEEYQGVVNALLASMEKAATYLKKGSTDPEKMRAWIQEDVTEKSLKKQAAPSSALINTQEKQRVLIWEIASLLPAGPFGDTPFCATSPVGIVHEGYGLFSKTIFSELPSSLFGDSTPFFSVQVGSLTLGASEEDLVRHLSVATQKNVIVTYAGKVVCAYTQLGTKMAQEISASFPIDQMLGQRSGTVEREEKTSHFFQLTPLKEIDLHFLIVE